MSLSRPMCKVCLLNEISTLTFTLKGIRAKQPKIRRIREEAKAAEMQVVPEDDGVISEELESADDEEIFEEVDDPEDVLQNVVHNDVETLQVPQSSFFFDKPLDKLPAEKLENLPDGEYQWVELCDASTQTYRPDLDDNIDIVVIMPKNLVPSTSAPSTSGMDRRERIRKIMARMEKKAHRMKVRHFVIEEKPSGAGCSKQK